MSSEDDYSGYRRPYGRKVYVAYPQPYLPTGKPQVRTISELPPPHHRQSVAERPQTEVRRMSDSCPGTVRQQEEVRVTKETLSEYRNYDLESYPWHLVPKEGSANLYARNVVNVDPDGVETVILDIEAREGQLLQITRFGHSWFDNMLFTIYANDDPVLQYDFQMGQIANPHQFDTPESMRRFRFTVINNGAIAREVEALIIGWREERISQIGGTRFRGFDLGSNDTTPAGPGP